MVVKHEETGDRIFEEQYTPEVECHFLHVEGNTVAALSHCTEDDIVWLSLECKIDQV